MPNTKPVVLEELTTEVTRATTVAASAAALLRGIVDRITAAVAAALENGATAEQLAPVQAEVDALQASTDDLSAAIIENTPAANGGQGGNDAGNGLTGGSTPGSSDARSNKANRH